MILNNPFSPVKYLSLSYGKGVYDSRTKKAFIIYEYGGFTSKEFEKGSTYEGGWDYKNAVKSGNGKYVSCYDDEYEGEFKNDEPDGYGKMTYNTFQKVLTGGRADNGISEYEGEWKNGRYDGKGTAHCHSDKIEGIWSHGYLNGETKIRFENGDVFVGDIQHFPRNGTIYYKNGDVYEGEVRRTFATTRINAPLQRRGKGKLTKKDGTILEGRFYNGTYSHREYEFPGKDTLVSDKEMDDENEIEIQQSENTNSST